ncbi:ribonuclease [Psychromonas sp. psych-6C06]|uniref:PhoH family protein n=1 Tax=Psychromonas sp. psych-6C06 TaxID=2058089 RepID=UPI000C32D24A|nr:PhoH family protein [Psychromonas sp. psych-6C06]PKF63009.1 ribonuclease [Psychromonas sp. psych-6C06]
MGNEDRKFFILDTNILLHDPLAIYAFKEHNVVIPMTVLEELDRIKDRQKEVSRDARIVIRSLEDIFKDASPEAISQGVPLYTDNTEKSGRIAIFTDHHQPISQEFFTEDEPDNRIINSALYLQQVKERTQVILVTKDINMRLKAKGAGLHYVEDYRKDQLIDDIQLLSKGFRCLNGSFWDQVEDCESDTQGRDTFHHLDANLIEGTYCNEYILDETKQFAAKVISEQAGVLRLQDLGRDKLMSCSAWGVQPKNIYQAMAIDALLDPDIELVILTGPAGCGKTLLAMATALELVIEQGIYDKVIVTRNTPEIAESIGFLPGTEEDKMMPWLAAITDTLEVLHKNDECPNGSLDYIMEKANIQFKSVNFMRGRSIQNSFVLLDECQNLTASQLKTIITRCGEGTKIVCSGNLAQIDSNYLTPVTSGLTYIVERFKAFEGSANVYLNGVVRSRLASFAEENL